MSDTLGTLDRIRPLATQQEAFLIGLIDNLQVRLDARMTHASNLEDIVEEAAQKIEELEAELEREKAAKAVARAQRDRLWDALSWIDDFDPETTSAVEKRFGVDLNTRAFVEPPQVG